MDENEAGDVEDGAAADSATFFFSALVGTTPEADVPPVGELVGGAMLPVESMTRGELTPGAVVETLGLDAGKGPPA